METDCILKSVNLKNELFRKIQENPDDRNLNDHYKKYKNILQKIIEKTENNYFKKIIKENSESSIQMWKTINNICGKINEMPNIEQIKSSQGNKIISKQEITNFLWNTIKT